MMNFEIQYTGKFDMLTYVFRTNSVVVLSPDCNLIVDFCNYNRTVISILAKTTRTEINIVLQLKLNDFKCT